MAALRTAAHLLTAGLLTAAVACSEPTTPTATPPTTVALAVGSNTKVKVKSFQLSANTLRINGAAVMADLTIGNSGLAIPSGVSIQAVITQGTASREAANVPLVCSGSGPADVGKLPTGNCDASFAAKASNSTSGTGTLSPGPAMMTVRVMPFGRGTTELASKSIAITLVAAPTIGTLALAATTLVIDGQATSYTATLQNPGTSLPGVRVEAWITQAVGGVVRRSAGGTLVSCGSNAAGVLPGGTCSITLPATASNSASGTGTLVPGPATFELQLIQSGGGASTSFDTKTVGIVIISGTPKITSVTLQSNILVIGGANVGYTVKLQNAGLPQTDVVLQGVLEQDQGGGVTVVKGAGGTLVPCGAGLGVLPTTGTSTCTFDFSVATSSSTIGGALAAGPARFVLYLSKAAPNVDPIEYDKRIIAVTLVPPTPSIVSVIPASSYVVLDKTDVATPVSVSLSNPGPALSTVIVQGEIRQGASFRGAGGSNVACGAALGTLPNGGCVESSLQISASNAAGGEGTLVPGNATYVLTLLHFDGVNTTTLDSRIIPITLVASVPSIVSTSLATSTLVINGARANYTAVVYNPTGASLTGTFVQTYVDQGTSSSPAGGLSLACTTTIGAMPPGSCLVSFTFGAANTPVTTGLLVAGSAFFRIELWQNATLLAVTSVPITLTSP
jgi:hypothetical protein